MVEGGAGVGGVEAWSLESLLERWWVYVGWGLTADSASSGAEGGFVGVLEGVGQGGL